MALVGSNITNEPETRDDDDAEDRISTLPHEILVCILSLLTIKEAAKTSLLSRRWKDLWTHSTGSLCFDDPKSMNAIQSGSKVLRIERFKFVGWVNRVVESHQGLSITDFKLRFHLNNRSRRYIDRWIGIALAKKVQNLELDFTPFLCTTESLHYVLSINIPVPGLNSPCVFPSLRSLILKSIDVTSESLQFFIASCPLLETLCVKGSKVLSNLTVVESAHFLKSLEIHRCDKLSNLEIYAPNLVSLCYKGLPIRVHVENTTMLSQLSYGILFGHVHDFLVRFATFLHQLESLHLSICNCLDDELLHFQLPVLTNLRNLTLVVSVSSSGSLLGLIPLIEASPFLHNLKLELIWLDKTWKRRKARRFTVIPNQYLKVLVVDGFQGHAVDYEFVMYLLEMAIMLEEMVISIHSPLTSGCPPESKGTGEEHAARKVAEQLRTKLPDGANLVIL